MITKEEYVKIRDEEEFPIYLVWEYWNEVKPANYPSLTLAEFTDKFTNFIQFFGVPLLTPNGMKMVTYETLIDKVYKYFNKKFSV